MASNRAAIPLNAVHTSGSSGTNVRCTGIACFLCWAGNGPDRSKIAKENRIALILRLLQPHFWNCYFAPSVAHPQRPGLARAVARKQDVNTNSRARVAPGTGFTRCISIETHADGSLVSCPAPGGSADAKRSKRGSIRVSGAILGISRLLFRNIPLQLAADQFLQHVDANRLTNPPYPLSDS